MNIDRLEHKVVITVPKDIYDTTTEKWKRLSWLNNNIGIPFTQWTSHVDDRSSPGTIKIEYGFKDPKDAIMFALKWS